MKIKTIITGSTGMVGEGVLKICLNSSEVESVLVVNRKPCGVQHPKLKEVIVKDFMDLSEAEVEFANYNTCYFCSGVSSVGKKEDEYKKITYDLTLNFAKSIILSHTEPLTMGRLSSSETISQSEVKKDKIDFTFCYVSGSGTDSSEKGRLAWARIKGKTENDLLKLPFRDAYMFRPGYIEPIEDQQHAYKFYKIFSPIYSVLEKLFPKYVGTMKELGNSMINVTQNGYEKKVLEVVDIREIGNRP